MALFLRMPIWNLRSATRSLEPYDMSKLDAVTYHGKKIYVSTLEMLKKDNTIMGRADRVKMIEECMEAEK